MDTNIATSPGEQCAVLQRRIDRALELLEALQYNNPFRGTPIYIAQKNNAIKEILAILRGTNDSN